MNNKHIEEKDKDIVKIKKYIIKEFLPDINNIDVIKGYRADNSYFAIIRSFLVGNISLRKFFNLVQEYNLCEQLVLVSENVVNSLSFKYAENVDYINCYYNILFKDMQIQLKLNDNDDNDYIFIKDIIKDKWTNDDERLRRMLH